MVQWVKISPSNAGSVGLIPAQEAGIPHALWPKKTKTIQKQYCNKFNKDFKNGPNQKKKALNIYRQKSSRLSSSERTDRF